MPSLIEISGQQRRSFELGASETIGRDPSSTILIIDPRVSRRHAELRRTPEGRFELVDLGSSAGCYVGGRRVATAVLNDGDEILLGTTRLRFVERGEADGWFPADVDIVTQIMAEVKRRMPVPATPHFPPSQEIENLDELRRDYEKLRAAYELSRAIGAEQDIAALLDHILDTAFHLLAADRGAILLIDPATNRPTLQVARRRSGARARMVLSRTLVNEAIQKRAGVISADVGIDERFSRSQSIMHEGVRSTMCVPMIHRGELLAVMVLDSLEATAAFGEKDLDLFTSIASEAALAIKNALLRQRIEEVTQAERSRLERLVRDLPIGVLLLDGKRRIVLANQRAEQLLPLLGDAATGGTLGRLGTLPLDEVVARSRLGSVDVVLGGPPRRVVAVRATTTSPTAGEVELVVALQDVTAERENEERNARADRMALVGQLAGGIAHDFNNLLTIILNYSEVLSQGLKDSPLVRDVEPIREAGRRAAALTEQLLAFSRKQVIKPRTVDLNAVVGGMAIMMRRALGEDIQLSTQLASSLWPVLADPGKLEQVLLNLVVNARDAMPRGGRLSITTSNVTVGADSPSGPDEPAPGRYVLLEVIDTGCGMTPEVAARIFEPFFTTKEVGKGMGLGLATVWGIVQQAGGRIKVTTAPELGSTFRVFYPAAEVAEEVRPEPRPIAAGERRVVLLVEDEEAVRAIAKRTLVEAGYVVFDAPDGWSAIGIAQCLDAIDLVVTDVVMPRMSGKELVVRLRERWPQLPAMFVSGYSERETGGAEALSRLGRLVKKPFDRAELLGQIQAALEGRAA